MLGQLGRLPTGCSHLGTATSCRAGWSPATAGRRPHRRAGGVDVAQDDADPAQALGRLVRRDFQSRALDDGLAHHGGDCQHRVAHELVADLVAALEALERGGQQGDLGTPGRTLARRCSRRSCRPRTGGQLRDGERVALGVEHAGAGAQHDAPGLQGLTRMRATCSWVSFGARTGSADAGRHGAATFRGAKDAARACRAQRYGIKPCPLSYTSLGRSLVGNLSFGPSGRSPRPRVLRCPEDSLKYRGF
jgi:hypothetical protein